MVVDSHGDIGASSGGSDGLFHADTRFLSHLELRLNNVQPLLLGSNVRDDNTLLAVDLTNPDLYAGGHIALQKDIVHVARTIFLWRGTAYQRIAVRNHGLRAGRDRRSRCTSTTISPTCSRCAASAARGAASPRAGASPAATRCC